MKIVVSYGCKHPNMRNGNKHIKEKKKLLLPPNSLESPLPISQMSTLPPAPNVYTILLNQNV
jgi:hypothetical protein